MPKNSMIIPSVSASSPNLQTQLAQQLHDLAPDVFSEGKVDVQKLMEVLGADGADTEAESERFGLFWPGKRKAQYLAQQPSTATLKPDFEQSKDWNTTQNIYIEGDNLEVLKLLQPHYHNQIKMIYIDPPYNTGNDFVYPDDFKDGLKTYLEYTQQSDGSKSKKSNTESDGRYHSNWLNMMYPRLKLARNLLTDDGVIFISIDDHEVAHLRKICDEIFGEDNFVGIFSVENNPKGRKNSKFISVSNEYCLVFAKCIDQAQFENVIPKEASDMDQDENGDFIRRSGKRVLVGENFLNNPVTDQSSDKHYSVYYNRTSNEIRIEKEDSVGNVNQPLIANGFTRYITYRDNIFVENTYSQKKFFELFTEGKLNIKDKKIYEKHFSELIQIKSMLTNQKFEAIFNNKHVLYELDLKTTSAKQNLKELMGNSLFDFPKNTSFLKILAKLITSDSDIVLDFFSGSATTAQAVMELNAEDGGNRRHIQVQLPEPTAQDSEAHKAGYKTIADIGKERIRRAGEKIKKDQVDKLTKRKTPLDVGFRVFKLDHSNFKQWRASSTSTDEELQQQLLDQVNPVTSTSTEEDILTELLLKSGKSLSAPMVKESVAGLQIWNVDSGKLYVYMSKPKPTLEQLEAVTKLKPEKLVVLDRCFHGDDSLMRNLLQVGKQYDVEIFTE